MLAGWDGVVLRGVGDWEGRRREDSRCLALEYRPMLDTVFEVDILVAHRGSMFRMAAA